MGKPDFLLQSLYLYFVLLELVFPALQNSPPGAFKPPPAHLKLLPHHPLSPPSLTRLAASFCFPVFSPIIEPPEFGSVGGVAKKTQQQRGREEEERRSGGKVVPSLPLGGNRRGGGGGGYGEGRGGVRSEEGKKKEMGTGEGERGSITLPKKQVKSQLDRPESCTSRHSQIWIFIFFIFLFQFFPRAKQKVINIFLFCDAVLKTNNKPFFPPFVEDSFNQPSAPSLLLFPTKLVSPGGPAAAAGGGGGGRSSHSFDRALIW